MRLPTNYGNLLIDGSKIRKIVSPTIIISPAFGQTQFGMAGSNPTGWRLFAAEHGELYDSHILLSYLSIYLYIYIYIDLILHKY
jgi:hypothetical protein